MSVKLENGSAVGGLNMTPVIDVVFLLLIFFLVATKLEEEERQLKVALPKASEAVPLTSRPDEIVVTISHDGEFVVAGSSLPLPALETQLMQAAANNPGRQTVIIRGDSRAQLADVVAVMNLCTKAGIADYRIATSED